MLKQVQPSGDDVVASREIFVWTLDEAGLESLHSKDVPWFGHMFQKPDATAGEDGGSHCCAEDADPQVKQEEDLEDQPEPAGSHPEFALGSGAFFEAIKPGEFIGTQAEPENADNDVVTLRDRTVHERFASFVQEFSRLIFPRGPPILGLTVASTIQKREEFHVAVIDAFLETISSPSQTILYQTLCDLGALRAGALQQKVEPQHVFHYVEKELQQLTQQLQQAPPTTGTSSVVDLENHKQKDRKVLSEDIDRLQQQLLSLRAVQQQFHDVFQIPRPQILTPILTRHHFQLLQIQPQLDRIICYDNMGGFAPEATQQFTDICQWIGKVLTGRDFRVIRAIDDLHSHGSNTECGPFVCLFASILLHGNPELIPFCQEQHAFLFRQQVARVLNVRYSFV